MTSALFFCVFADDAALRMGGRFTQIPDGLYITSVETSDAGTYICEARNIAGSVESSGTLSIQGQLFTLLSKVIIYWAV